MREMTPTTQFAYDYAAKAHEGQFRKYSGEPYITHPLAVMHIVQQIDHDENMLQAALLHDVIEDTYVTEDEMRQSFNEDVCNLVIELTKVSKKSDGNRATRKRIDVAFLAGVSARAQTIKLADRIHNMSSMIVQDPEFAKLYVKESAELLKVLTKGDIHLKNRYAKIVEQFYGM